MSYQTYDEKNASTKDRIAWALCQIIDDDAPLRWTRYRFAAECIAGNKELMKDLRTLANSAHLSDAVVKARQRHGKPFSFESGSDWKPHDTPVLTEWLQSRGKGEK